MGFLTALLGTYIPWVHHAMLDCHSEAEPRDNDWPADRKAIIDINGYI